MKIKTNRHYLPFIALALVIALSGCFASINTQSPVYAETATFEEFDAQLGDIRAQLAKHENRLERIKTLGIPAKYQNILDLLEKYINTETVIEWRTSGFGVNKRYVMIFGYDAAALGALVAGIQAVEPDYKLNSDIAYNNIASSLLNIQAPELAAAAYEMLYVGHINFMLNNAQDYFEHNSTANQSLVLTNFQATVNSGFEIDLLPYIYTAALYNRILKHESFTEVQQLFRIWQEQYGAGYTKLENALMILEHGEYLTKTEYYPASTGFGANKKYFGTSIAENLGETYTLSQLLEYLPNHTVWPKIDKDETIAFFQLIMGTEVQNLKAALRAIDPSLTDLDTKTLAELITLGHQVVEQGSQPDKILTTASPEAKNLTISMIKMNLNVLASTNPEAKYFTSVSAQSSDESNNLNQISAKTLFEHNSNQDLVWSYYSLIGNAALQIDRTVTDGLYPHEDWVIPPEPVEDPDDSDPTDSDPSDPSAPTQSTTNSTTEPSDSAPNTGMLSKIIPNAEAALGIAVAASTFIAFIIIRRRHSR